MATFYLDYVNGNDSNNGSSWALAWKTITSGATAARIAPGDVIRIAKSPAPTSIGNATWTNLSKTVTLATAQTQTIELCESAWTASANVTATASTARKEGYYSASLAIEDAFTTGKVAYKSFSALDLSSYQKISFWIQNTATITANYLKVVLCSDTSGNTIVDTFYIPAIPSIYKWLPLTIARNGGGNLGSFIRSIAVYADTDPGTIILYLDDFIACTTDGLNLQSLISKNSAEQGGMEGWYGIQSIDGTTILLDNGINNGPDSGMGYSGTTETVTTYKRETIKTALASSDYAVQEIQDSGTSGSNIEFQGGWNTSTNQQDGETFFDGLNGSGYGLYLSLKSYTTLNYLNFCRYNYGVYYYDSSNNTIITLSNANNNYCGVYYYDSSNNTITTLSNANNNDYYGVYYEKSYNNIIKSLSTSGNEVSGIYNDIGTNYLFNASIGETTEIDGLFDFANSRIFSHNHDQTSGYYKIFTDGGLIQSTTSVRHTASGIAWQLSPTSTNRSSSYPLNLVIARIACSANNQVTVKAWFRRDNTGITGRLICKGKQIAGVDSDVYADMTAAANTWEELTINFTPTEAGVVEIEAQAWGGTSYSVYVDDMTISQA